MTKRKADEWLTRYNATMKENDNLYRGLAKTFGLSECAFWILYILRTEDRTLSQIDLCEILYLPKQTVNSALKSLETEGYIKLLEGGAGRRKQIALTSLGLTLAKSTADRVINAEQNAVCALTAAEAEAFLQLFDKYTAELKENLALLQEKGDENSRTEIF